MFLLVGVVLFLIWSELFVPDIEVALCICTFYVYPLVQIHSSGGRKGRHTGSSR